MKITILEILILAELIWLYFKDTLLLPVWIIVILVILEIMGWFLSGILKYYTQLLKTKIREFIGELKNVVS